MESMVRRWFWIQASTHTLPVIKLLGSGREAANRGSRLLTVPSDPVAMVLQGSLRQTLTSLSWVYKVKGENDSYE